MRYCNSPNQLRKQSGAVIIAAFIILLVITSIGAASMKFSALDRDLVNMQRDYDHTFAAAETGLARVEAALSLNPFDKYRHSSSCDDSGDCFNPSCSNGLCFNGLYDEKTGACRIGELGIKKERKNVWQDPQLNVWQGIDRHRILWVANHDTPIKYIVEFLCFANRDLDLMRVGASAKNLSFSPFYRITVLATGELESTSIMLQSTYEPGTKKTRAMSEYQQLGSKSIDPSMDLAASLISGNLALPPSIIHHSVTQNTIGALPQGFAPNHPKYADGLLAKRFGQRRSWRQIPVTW